jgi:hypothetical protein
MKLTTNMVIQICGIIGAVGAALAAQTSLIHGTTALVIAAVIAVAQAISAYLGHMSNPDGTPAPKSIAAGTP